MLRDWNTQSYCRCYWKLKISRLFLCDFFSSYGVNLPRSFWFPRGAASRPLEKESRFCVHKVNLISGGRYNLSFWIHFQFHRRFILVFIQKSIFKLKTQFDTQLLLWYSFWYLVLNFILEFVFNIISACTLKFFFMWSSWLKISHSSNTFCTQHP